MRIHPALLVVSVLSLSTFGLLFAQRNGERPAQFSARGTHGAIAAGSGYATDAAMRMYYSGGNAVDAGVASIFAAATTEYSHVGWGGEAPILIRTKDGKVHSIAGVGTMPKLATADFYRNRPLQVGEILEPPEKGGLKGMIPVAGIMAALVPSLPEASLVALRDYGTKSFTEVVTPALEFADGSAIDEQRAGSIQASREFFTLWPTSEKHFMPDGRVPLPGEIFHQADLARSIRGMIDAEKKALAAGESRVAAIDAVRNYFYRGEIAKKIDEFSRAHQGLLRYDDMASFRLTPEEPVSTEFHGARVYKPGFWSQGPAMIETLNILDGIDLASMRLNSAQYIHTLTEALKLAYADRDTYYGDPKFVKIPKRRIALEEVWRRAAKADRRDCVARISTRECRVNIPAFIRRNHKSCVPKSTHFLMAHDTTCVDAIDKDGVMFSATPSGAWLPSVIAGDTGIPLTERAQSFLLVPGNPNELAGGKRPRVTLSPTLITHTDGTPWIVLSTPGGDNQEQALMQLMFDVVLFRLNPEQAIEMPRFETRHLVSSFDNHAMNPGDLQLDDRTSQSVIQDLANRGHKIGTRSRWSSGSAPGMVRVTQGGVIEAGADPWGYRSMQAY